MIRKVWTNNFSGQLLVTIPVKNEQEIIEGDFVKVSKVVPKIVEGKCLFKNNGAVCNKKYVDHTINELQEHDILEKVVK